MFENQGDLPNSFLISSTEKYQEQLERIDGNAQKRERIDRQLFYLESNFSIDNLIRSGKVLFNDPFSAYIREVAAKVLQGEAALLGKLKFYVIRSAAVNAFATNNGDIFVTLGLLAKLENEAQLAFILSHELVHVQKKHALNFYLESKEIDRNRPQRRILKQATFDDSILRKSTYSKEIEIEADDLGVDRFQRTRYAMSEIKGAFEVLRAAELPFGNIPFEQSFFEDEYISFPKKYFLDETTAPILVAGPKESNTHPGINERIEAIAKKVKNDGPLGQKKFLLLEKRFRDLQKMARFEVVHQLLRDHNYQMAIYNAYVLLQEDKESVYLKKIIAKALAGLTKFRNNNQDGIFNANEKQGESQQVFQLIKSMSNPELNALALRYTWLLKKNHPEDKEIGLVATDIFQELVNNHFLEIGQLSKMPRPKNNGSPIEKSRAQLTESFARYAFVDLLKDPDFVDEFDNRINTRELGYDREEFYNSIEGSKELSKRSQRRKKKGYRLGIDRIVIVDPFYLKMDVRKENIFLYEESEVAQREFVDLLALNAYYARLEATIINKSTLEKEEMEVFNEIVRLNEWMDEKGEYENLGLQSVQQHKINQLAEKYGTDYFAWTGVFSLREENTAALYSALYGLVFPPYLPFGAYTLAKGKYDMLYFCIVYDVKTGRYYTVKYEMIGKEDTKTILSSQTYDAFYQIKVKDKRKIE